jgi:ABC-2 type transport system permease protein
MILAGAALVAGWAVVPLCAFGADETLDVARLAAVPFRGRRLVPGLTVAALLGCPGIATALVLAATVLTWSGDPAAAVLAGAGALVAAPTCVLACRVVTGLAGAALGSRHGRETLSSTVVLLAVGLAAMPAVLVSNPVGGWWREVAGVLGWTPLGLPFAAPADGAGGHVARGAVRIVLAVVVLLALAETWAHLIEREWARGPRSAASSRPHPGRRFPAHAGPVAEPDAVARAIGRRTAVYWRRDPRYLSVLVAIVMVGGAIVALGRAGGLPAFGWAVGPLTALFVGLAVSADLGYDGSAFAAHLAAGVSGRDDRAGRLLGTLGWSLPVVLAAGGAAAVLGGDAPLAPVAAGLSVAVLLGACAAATVIGVLVPYPMPQPGASPFRGSPGSGGAAIVAQSVVSLAALGACLPVLVVAFAGAAIWRPLGWLSLPAGLVLGGLGLVVAVRWAGRTLDDRGPEILAAVRRSA